MPSGSFTVNAFSFTSCSAVLTYSFTPYLSCVSRIEHLVIGSASIPICGSISMIVHFAPRGAKYSITSSPTEPPPTTTTFLSLQDSSGYLPAFKLLIISKIVATLPAAIFSFRPLIGGTSGTEPVALTTISGLNSFTFSMVASVFRKTYRFFSLAARASRYFGKSFIRVLLGRSEIKVESPPR